MSNWMRGRPSDSIFKNMALLLAGNMAGRVISIATLPILARIYSPENFGLLSVFNSLVMMSVPLATFYATAIPLPKSNQFAINVLAISFITLAIWIVAFSVVLWWASRPILDLFSASSLAPFWPILVAGSAVAGAFQILTQWSTRRKAFRLISVATMTQSLGGAASKLALGLLGFTSFGLLLGGIIQHGSGGAQLARKLGQDVRVNYLRPSRRGMRKALRRFHDFPTFRLPSQVLMAFTAQALPLASASLFSLEVAGQVGLAVSVLVLPTSLLGRSIGQAFYGEVASLGRRHPRQIRETTKSVILRLLLVSAPAALVLFFFGPSLFQFVFGDEWRLAGQISATASAYIVMSLISVPIIHVINVVGNQGFYLRVNLVRAAWTILIFLAAHLFSLGAMTTIATYYVVLSIHLLIVLISVMRLLNRKAKLTSPT